MLLAEKGPLAKDKKEEGPSKSLLFYFIAELRGLIEEKYLQSCLDLIRGLLLHDEFPFSPTESEQGVSATDQGGFNEIYTATTNLLSTLIDREMSIESLYKIYSEVLVPRQPKENYKFERKFDLMVKLLTQPERKYHIALALENVTAPENIPSQIGGVTFSVSPPFEITGIKTEQTTGKYLTQSPRRLFASIVITAQDSRTAGSKAVNLVNDIFSLVRFEYERAKVTMPNYFAFVQTDKENCVPRTFSLPAVVPNPSASMDGDGLSSFIKSVNELVLCGNLQAEGQDRVQSAFRLYRTGLDSSILENKLVNWWTATEYLVRGNNGQEGGIGKSVEMMLYPVLCNAYIAKHLHAFRNALLEMGVTLTDPANGESIALKGMSTIKLYQLMKSKALQQVILDTVKNHVFAEQQLTLFFSDLDDPKHLHSRNHEHEQRLRGQLQRLWRARCDIVHSADRTVSAVLLCANLEYYLKTTLMALLKTLREVPTLSGPKEFFDRQAYTYEVLQTDLKDGNDGELIRILSV